MIESAIIFSVTCICTFVLLRQRARIRELENAVETARLNIFWTEIALRRANNELSRLRSETFRASANWRAERAHEQYRRAYAEAQARAHRDWRDVLGFPESERPSRHAINKRYRELAKKHHPDAGGDATKMAKLNTARKQALSEVPA